MFLLMFKSLISSRKAFYVEVMKSLMKTSASGNQSENYEIGNMKKFIWSAIAVVAISACQLEDPHSDTIMCDDDVFYAAIHDEGSSKTVMDENNNIRWSAGDQIVIFKKTSLGLKYQIQDSYVGETSGYFSKVTSVSGSDDFGAGMSLEHNIAYYPYSSDVKIARSGDNYSLKIALPSEQTYVPESFGSGSFPMAAVSEDTDLTFKNVCGGIKLQFTGTCKVASIRIEGKNNEKISGAAAVTVYTDEGVPVGLCRAKRLYYVTTAGGTIFSGEFGYGYIRTLTQGMYGIPETFCFQAEGLDVAGADVDAILSEVEGKMDAHLKG
jgi:hypothetical protein